MTKKSNEITFPNQGIVFWPVGTGDSTTIIVDDEIFMQIDLNHLACSEEDNDPHLPIIDRLKECLPKANGKPYLSVFVLTHPDQDHCRDFAKLLKNVHIGELWFTPRVFREYKKDLCDDAKVLKDEAKRRVKKTIKNNGEVNSGDRVRIIGYDDILQEDDYSGFPKDRLTIPGNSITQLDGVNVENKFKAFIHAPFKDDSTSDRNDTSVALQLSLFNANKKTIKALFWGDLCYPTLRKIFNRSNDEDLEWNIMLAAHHCSKHAMYWQSDDDDEESLKQDILDDMENSVNEPGYIVASSEPIPTSNKPGDNPPHALAKNRYVEIAPDGFLCTQEYPDENNPLPIIFELGDEGVNLLDLNSEDAKKTISISAAVSKARDTSEPPSERVGFGYGYD